MQLTFLGKSTQGGGSPTLYATDRETYVVQGWRVEGMPENHVEIPESLLNYLSPGTKLGVPLSLTGNRWRGDGGEWDTYALSGRLVADEEALMQLRVPTHESCIEVGKTWKESEDAPPARL